MPAGLSTISQPETALPFFVRAMPIPCVKQRVLAKAGSGVNRREKVAFTLSPSGLGLLCLRT